MKKLWKKFASILHIQYYISINACIDETDHWTFNEIPAMVKAKDIYESWLRGIVRIMIPVWLFPAPSLPWSRYSEDRWLCYDLMILLTTNHSASAVCTTAPAPASSRRVLAGRAQLLAGSGGRPQNWAVFSWEFISHTDVAAGPHS